MDTGSSISCIPVNLVNGHKLNTEKTDQILVQQAKGLLTLNTACYMNLKIGNITKRIKVYVVNSELKYMILGLPDCAAFHLNIDCYNSIVKQDKNVLTNLTNLSKPVSLHLINEENLNNGISLPSTSGVTPCPQIVNKEKLPILLYIDEILK